MKQTAVEWLENEFQEIFKEWGGLDTHWIKRFDQAKAMEKEQIIDAWDNGCEDDGIIDNAEQYYNETFKSE
jgi:hypothetical protein